ncbi:hypothetical protein C7S13_8061 [Burkholderia cepacia]|nr:hypothetical protein [Burkholderia cepacia]
MRLFRLPRLSPSEVRLGATRVLSLEPEWRHSADTPLAAK